MKTISIAPAFNEETRVGDFLKKYKESKQQLVDTICIINDGSTDKTKEIAESYGALVLSHEKRKGLGAALKTGIKYAIENNYEIIVILAPNGKDNPLEIPNVTKPITENIADYVQGSRYLNGSRIGKSMPILRRFATRLHPLLIRLITGFHATDSTNGFRAIRASLLKDKNINLWQKWLDTTSFEFYLYLKIIQLKYRIVEVPVSKIYLKTVHHLNYTKSGSMTKTKPIIDWYYILRPLIYYIFGSLH